MQLFRNSYIKLAIASVIILASAGTYMLSGTTSMTVEAVTSTTAALPISHANNPATSAGSAVANSGPKTSTAICQQGNASHPAAPHAEAAEPGLHQVLQTPGKYTVYGNTADEINGQMLTCTPIGDDGDRFAASTEYSLNWAFNFIGGSDELCRITDVSVSINISQTFPAWQPASGAAPAVSALWQKYITNLATHENGHVKIDQAGAAQLLADLQNFPATSCNTIVADATTKASNNIQTINQANDNYDISTNHGTTQGAVLN